jgi:HAD superfamily hydrolase (TIGR01509 family)
MTDAARQRAATAPAPALLPMPLPVPNVPMAAALFDLDGLLVDSEPIWSIAEQEVMTWLGGPWDPSVKAACLGKAISISSGLLVAIAGSDVDPAVVQDRLLRRMAELFRAQLPWHAGARELLDSLAARGVPLALVSSSHRVLVDAALETIGADRFATTLAGDEVTQPKPHPEPYLTAARRLGVDPAACVVFEDSPAGVTSAEAAGCRCVAVPDVVPIPADSGRLVLPSLIDVVVDTLLSQASG